MKQNNYLKKMGQNIGNYINIAWTLAMRHQYLQCYHNICGDSLFDSCTETGPGMYSTCTPYDIMSPYVMQT